MIAYFYVMFLIMIVRLSFSSYASDGSDTDEFTGFVYDATMAYFYAVDYMIKNKMVTVAALNTTHLSGRLMKKILADNITFVGVTGNVDFSSGRVGSKTFGYGDRSAGQGYVIYNFHNNATWGAFKRIGRWSDEYHYLNCDVEPNPNGNGYIITPEFMGGCYLPMQTSMDDHITLLKDRADDIVQRMPFSLKVSFISHTMLSHMNTVFNVFLTFSLRFLIVILSYCSRPCFCFWHCFVISQLHSLGLPSSLSNVKQD